MTYRALPVTQNTLKLREEYLSSPVAQEDNPYIDRRFRHFCTGDRWLSLGFLEGYLAAEKAPTTKRRRAMAEAAELYAQEPEFYEHELLAGHVYFPEYTPEQRKRYDELVEMFRMSPISLAINSPRTSHLGVDLDKLLRVGLNGVIAEINRKLGELDMRDENVYPDMEVLRKYDYYHSCLLELEALLDLERRYAAKARELAATASPQRASQLLRMANALDKVPAEPARGFFDALQSVQFFLGTLFGLYTLNRPDRYLYPYYEADLKSGAITREEAQELIDNFCLQVSTRVFTRAACGFIVGGQNADGSLVENDLTYMFLTALDHIQMPDPNGALAVNEKTSDEILSYAREVLSHGTTHPAFYNDNAIVDSLVKYGVDRAEAVNYIHTTCAEISVVGKTRAHTTSSSIAMPQLLGIVLESCDDSTCFEAIQSGLLDLLRAKLSECNFNYLMRVLEAGRNSYDYIRTSVLVDDCIERGRDLFDGGAKYCFLQPILIGFSTCVDSLVAIRTLVYEEKHLTLSAFKKIVAEDYAGHEALRQYIVNKLPHYGNDDASADEMAVWLGEAIRRLFEGGRIMAAKIMMPGTFSYISHAKKGRLDGASYDGRHAHTSYSDGCGPVQGRDVNGPTAMLLSMTKWDQRKFLAGMVINMKFSPEHLTEAHNAAFVAMLRTFIQRGGMEMQVNAVDRKTLLDAQIHPEAHRDLVVRIGGFSDYFVRLIPELQNEIIARTEY
ncbi:MAG: hypothetical protein IKP00_12205 [Victivallales bacterium]|nr:hypothetical protein [Victivallales bacterium]